jgi:hypothetical protein
MKKEYTGCWECTEFENCSKLDFLGAVHNDAHLENIRKIKKQGIARFLKGKKYW